MRPSHDPPRRRRTARAVTLTSLAAAVLLLPGTALASPDTSASCDDPLVTYTRDGADGDQTAVALTAQSIERGVAGWDHVSWSAASGTTLTGVYATDAHGNVTALDASATGTANEVVALTFCGTAEPVTLSATDPAEAQVEPETDGSDEDDAAEDAGPGDGSGTDGEEDTRIHIEFEPEAIIELEDDDADDESEQSTGDDRDAGVAGAADDESEPDDAVRTDDVEVAPVDAAEGAGPSNPDSGVEASAGDGGAADPDPDATADPEAGAEETEVLGVTIVAEADPAASEASEARDTAADPIVARSATSRTESSSGPLLPVSVQILLALAALLGLAAAVRAARSPEVSR